MTDPLLTDGLGSLDLSSPFLPASLPAGDPSTFALPVFLEEPEDTYVVKGRAASLRCRVAHALSVHVQCNDEVQEGAVITEGEQGAPKNGIKYTEARMEVTRDQVEEFFGDYHCACVAYSGQGRASSRLARVAIAYIKKEFEVPPYSAQEVVGRQVELRCHAPRGKPEPHLSWLKDGRQVAEDEDGIIVTTEGHLIIVSARLQDSGNFTCVAQNLAGVRRSPAAEILILGEFGATDIQRLLLPCRFCGGLVLLELLVLLPVPLRPRRRAEAAGPGVPGGAPRHLQGPRPAGEALPVPGGAVVALVDLVLLLRLLLQVEEPPLPLLLPRTRHRLLPLPHPPLPAGRVG